MSQRSNDRARGEPGDEARCQNEVMHMVLAFSNSCTSEVLIITELVCM